MTELLRGPRALGVMTRLAGDGQIRDAIGAVAHRGDDVLDLQRDTGGVAGGALPANLFEQICSYLVARQRSLLVLDARDLGVLHELGIALHQFQRERADPTPVA